MRNKSMSAPKLLVTALLSAMAVGSAPSVAQEAPTSTMTVLHPEQEGALLVEQGGSVSIPKGTLWVYSRHKSAVKILNSAKVEVERVGLAGGAEVARSAKALSKENLKVTEA